MMARVMFRDSLGSLAAVGPDEEHRLGEQLQGRASAPQERGLGLEMPAHAVRGERRISRDDGARDRRMGSGGLRPDRAQALPVRRVHRRDPVEDLDEELQSGIAARRRDQGVERARVSVDVRLAIDEGTEPRAVLLAEACRGERARQLLEQDARLEHLVQPGVDPVEVEDDRVDHRAHRRLRDHEPPARPPAGPCDLLVLEEADRLAEHGPAHPVALEQLGLRAQHLADRPAERHDVLDDAVGDPLGPLDRPRGRRRRVDGGVPDGRWHGPTLPVGSDAAPAERRPTTAQTGGN